MSKKKKKTTLKEEEILKKQDDTPKEDKVEENDTQETANKESDDECQELKDRIKELEDEKLRDLADFENIKKRYEKEKSQAVAYAQESFARDLLSVIDSLDSAAALEVDEKKLKESLEKIKEGIELTVEQLKKVFEKHGIELINIENEFDPNFHEAIMQVDSDEHQKGEIVQVFQKGYKYKDRVLRPAMVSIAK